MTDGVQSGPRFFPHVGIRGDAGCRYYYDCLLGRGAYGLTYRVVDVHTGGDAAVKIIPLLPDGDSPTAATTMNNTAVIGAPVRLSRKDRVQMELDHMKSVSDHFAFPRLLGWEYVDTAQEGRAHALVFMECCKNGDLHNAIYRRVKPIPGHAGRISLLPFQPVEVDLMFVQLTIALNHIHRHGAIHRDIKAANILISQVGSMTYYKLSDFGLATVKAAPRTSVGTFEYMAPEQYENDQYTNKVDVWAAGVVLYEMIALQRPFQSDARTFEKFASKVRQRDFRELHPRTYEWVSRYSPELLSTVHQMLTVNPRLRPSAADLLNSSYGRSAVDNFLRWTFADDPTHAVRITNALQADEVPLPQWLVEQLNVSPQLEEEDDVEDPSGNGSSDLAGALGENSTSSAFTRGSEKGRVESVPQPALTDGDLAPMSVMEHDGPEVVPLVVTRSKEKGPLQADDDEDDADGPDANAPRETTSFEEMDMKASPMTTQLTDADDEPTPARHADSSNGAARRPMELPKQFAPAQEATIPVSPPSHDPAQAPLANSSPRDPSPLSPARTRRVSFAGHGVRPPEETSPQRRALPSTQASMLADLESLSRQVHLINLEQSDWTTIADAERGARESMTQAARVPSPTVPYQEELCRRVPSHGSSSADEGWSEGVGGIESARGDMDDDVFTSSSASPAGSFSHPSQHPRPKHAPTASAAHTRTSAARDRALKQQARYRTERRIVEVEETSERHALELRYVSHNLPVVHVSLLQQWIEPFHRRLLLLECQSGIEVTVARFVASEKVQRLCEAFDVLPSAPSGTTCVDLVRAAMVSLWDQVFVRQLYLPELRARESLLRKSILTSESTAAAALRDTRLQLDALALDETLKRADELCQAVTEAELPQPALLIPVSSMPDDDGDDDDDHLTPLNFGDDSPSRPHPRIPTSAATRDAMAVTTKLRHIRAVYESQSRASSRPSSAARPLTARRRSDTATVAALRDLLAKTATLPRPNTVGFETPATTVHTGTRVVLTYERPPVVPAPPLTHDEHGRALVRQRRVPEHSAQNQGKPYNSTASHHANKAAKPPATPRDAVRSYARVLQQQEFSGTATRHGSVASAVNEVLAWMRPIVSSTLGAGPPAQPQSPRPKRKRSKKAKKNKKAATEADATTTEMVVGSDHDDDDDGVAGSDVTSTTAAVQSPHRDGEVNDEQPLDLKELAM